MKDNSDINNGESIVKCQHCDVSLAENPFFYTFATNGYMFGFFCCIDCANSSQYAPYFRNASALRINATAASHRDLVVVPTLQTLKQFKEESDRRALRKKYFD